MIYDFESEKAKNFPSIVQLTITNVCDMSCGHCPHPSYVKDAGYKSKYMSMDLFKRVADEVGHHENTSLRIFGWGEPNLHPNLIDMVAYAKNNNVNLTNLITNGLKLDENMSAGLINAGLDVLEVSVDAYKKETYELVRGKNFDKVVNNVHNFVKLRDKLKGSTYVTVSFITQPKAIDELEQFKEYWRDVVDDVVIRKFHDFMGFAKNSEEIVLPERHPCRCLWSRFNINSDGLVNLCFNDWYNVSVLGNINEEGSSIEKIWKSDVYEAHRKSQLEGKPKGICETCNDWIGASWEFPYEILMQKAKQKIEERRRK